MIDAKAYYDANESQQPRLGLATRRTDDDDDDFERSRPRYDGLDKPRDFRADFRADRKIEGRADFTDPYSHYDDIDPYTCESLEPEQYLICDYKVWACVLKTREWGKVAIWSNSSTITKTEVAQSCST